MKFSVNTQNLIKDKLKKKEKDGVDNEKSKIKFDGSDIQQICNYLVKNSAPHRKMTRNERKAFDAFRDVSYYLLSSKSHPKGKTSQELVDELFRIFNILE